jgi:WD40 repeat protein
MSAATQISMFRGHHVDITAICNSNGDNYLCTGSTDTKIKLWDQRQVSCAATFREHKGAIHSIRMSPDGKWVASGSADGTLKIWDITADKVLANFEHPGHVVTTLEFNP